MALALSDLLPDFGSRGSRAGGFPAAPAPMPEPVLPAPIVDVKAMIADEVAKAEAAATERLSAIYEATLEAERDRHAAESEDLRRHLGAAAAELVSDRLAVMEERLAELTTTAIARMLGGMLTDQLQHRAIAALAGTIREAIHDRDAVRVRVQGPQSLCEALASALDRNAPAVEFTERPTFDLAVDIDGSIYETRLAEWSAELAAVLA